MLRPASSLVKYFLYQNRCSPRSDPREKGVAASGAVLLGLPHGMRSTWPRILSAIN